MSERKMKRVEDSLTEQSHKTFRNTNTVNYNFKDIIKNKDHNLNVLVGEETINKKSSLNDDRLSFFPERKTRLELATPTLARLCSTN